MGPKTPLSQHRDVWYVKEAIMWQSLDRNHRLSCHANNNYAIRLYHSITASMILKACRVMDYWPAHNVAAGDLVMMHAGINHWQCNSVQGRTWENYCVRLKLLTVCMHQTVSYHTAMQSSHRNLLSNCCPRILWLPLWSLHQTRHAYLSSWW